MQNVCKLALVVNFTTFNNNGVLRLSIMPYWGQHELLNMTFLKGCDFLYSICHGICELIDFALSYSIFHYMHSCIRFINWQFTIFFAWLSIYTTIMTVSTFDSHEGFYKLSTKNCLSNLNSIIRAKSVGPLRRIYQWFSLLPIFNVDPHRTCVLARTPLLSATLKQGVGRGIPFLRQGFEITIPSHNRPQKLNSSTVNGWMELKKRGGPTHFGPDCRYTGTRVLANTETYLHSCSIVPIEQL